MIGGSTDFPLESSTQDLSRGLWFPSVCSRFRPSLGMYAQELASWNVGDINGLPSERYERDEAYLCLNHMADVQPAHAYGQPKSPSIAGMAKVFLRLFAFVTEKLAVWGVIHWRATTEQCTASAHHTAICISYTRLPDGGLYIQGEEQEPTDPQ